MAIEISIIPDITEPVSGMGVQLKPVVYYDSDRGVITYTVQKGLQDILAEGEYTVDFHINTATLPEADAGANQTVQAMVTKFVRREITRIIFEKRGPITQ